MRLAFRGLRAVGVLAVAAAAVVAASSQAAVSSSGASAPVIDKSAVLRYGAITVPANFDPHRERESGERKTLWLVWDHLTQMSPGSRKILPAIATSWKASADGLTWTFQLRKDAKFHDGSPVTAKDVAASVGRGKTLPGSTAAAVLAIVDSVRAVGKYTVSFKLNTQASYFPDLMATGAGTVISLKAIASKTDIATNPNDASSGPYIVKDFTPIQKATLDRSPVKYWDPLAGQVKEFQIQAFGGNDTAALNAILTNQVDVINVLSDFQTVDGRVKGSNLRHYGFKTAGLVSLFLNAKVKPLDDKRVRQAIAYAIDRQKIATGVMLNSAYYSQQGVLLRNPVYIKGYDPFPFNVARAKQLLAQAGFPNGFDLNILHPAGFAPAQNGALAIQDSLAAIGVRVKINPLAPADFTPRWSGGTQQAAITASPAFLSLVQQLNDICVRFNGKDPASATLVDAADQQGRHAGRPRRRSWRRTRRCSAPTSARRPGSRSCSAADSTSRSPTCSTCRPSPGRR